MRTNAARGRNLLQAATIGLALCLAMVPGGALPAAAETIAATVTATDVALKTGDPAPVSYAYTISDPAAATGVSCAPVGFTNTDTAGSYLIHCTGTDNAGYTVTYTDGTLSVTNKTATVTATDVALKTGDPAPVSYAYTISDPAAATGVSCAPVGFTNTDKIGRAHV